MIRVFLCDDHVLFRDGVRRLIEDAGDMAVVGVAGDGLRLLAAPELLEADVLLLDLSLPRLGGAEALQRIRALRPGLAVLILSMHPEDPYALQLLRHGAAGYLCKNCDAEELLRTIRLVARGRTYVSPTLAERLLQSPGSAEQPRHRDLSAREYQVFMLILDGRSVTEIAAELDLSVSTVSNHLRHTKEKLGVGSIAELVSYAHRAGLVEPQG